MPPRTPLTRALLAGLAILALTLALATQSVVQTASAAPPPFTVRAGTQQLEVLGARKGTKLELLHRGAVVGTGTVDAGGNNTRKGSFEWRLLKPGRYSVRTVAPAPAYESAPTHVSGFHAAAPDQSFYSGQTLQNGFNFIQTRDGTTLSANVVLPNPNIYGPGPYPTVVEYSGYDPSNPRETSFPTIFNTLGYAYVGVNIRGTGCSGGSFLPFEPVQSLDGYDAIETIAAQSWAKFHKVGMVGISYPGIEQLYVARTQPPHLSAISPLSVIDDTYRGTLWPGGILNTGFATSWATDRAHDAAPYGEGWEHDPLGATPQQVDQCAANQDVRLQNPDPVSTIEDNPFYNKTYYQRIDPSRFVHRINVPVYLAGAWQDEQTGGHFPDFLHRFTSSPHLFATMSNGSHTESLSLGEFGRYADFLDFYVAHRIPTGVKSLVGPPLAASLTGVTGLSMPPQPDYSGMTFKQAKHHYNASRPIRIEFEEGAAKGQPSGAPLPRFVRTFKSWPIPGRKQTRLYLTPQRRAVVVEGPGRQGARPFVLRRPEGSPADRLLRVEQCDLGRPPDVPLEADPQGQGPRLDHRAAEEEPRDDRQRLARRLGEVGDQGRRPRGHRQRRAAQRHRGLREQRVAAGQPPQADREAVDGDQAGAHRPASRRAADAAREVPAAPHRDHAVRPALPGRRPAAHHARRAGRCQAAVGVQDARPRAAGHDRHRPEAPVVAGAIGGAGRRRTDEGAAVPVAALPALSDLPRLKRVVTGPTLMGKGSSKSRTPPRSAP